MKPGEIDRKATEIANRMVAQRSGISHKEAGLIRSSAYSAARYVLEQHEAEMAAYDDLREKARQLLHHHRQADLHSIDYQRLRFALDALQDGPEAVPSAAAAGRAAPDEEA